MIKSAKLADLRRPLMERPAARKWELYDFEGTSSTKSPASCWQSLMVPAGEFYECYGERKQLRTDLDFVGSLRHGWRRRKRSRNRVEELVETHLGEYQHPILQFGLTTPHRALWGLELVDALALDRWEMADRIRGLHILVVEVESVVGLVPLDEATPWHLALAFILLGYLPPELNLEPWAEAVLHLDTPSIRCVREAWVEKHRRIIRHSQQTIRDARSWVPEPKEEKR
jgi:hypothetical protein